MVLFLLLLCMTGAALADTLYLKNGKQVEGICTGFEDDEFTMVVSNYYQVRFRADRVERLVIDRETMRRIGRDGDDWQDREGVTFSGTSPNGQWDNFDAFSVRPEDAWSQSPIWVYSGERVRMEASGTVTLDGRTKVTAEGLSGQRNRNAPMPGHNDGALIARIGQGSNALPVYVGRSSEFTADRDGVLYFAVNHPRTANSRGTFVVNVSVQRNSGDSSNDSAGRRVGTTRGRAKTVNVYGNQAWTDTGIDLEPNMTVEIVAEGQIRFSLDASSGPDGNRSLVRDSYPVKGAGVGAVIAKMRYRNGRDSNAVFIGARNTASIRQSEYGRLFIGVNDDNYGDNSGSYRVTIRW